MNHSILCASVTALFGALPASAGELDLTIDGFGSDRGQARIVVMKGVDEYSGTRAVTRVVMRPITNGTATWTAPLDNGEYVLIAHHDQDGNDALDRPVFGIPIEPYGYSNGIWTSLGLPDYRAVAFTIGQGGAHQHIRLRRNVFAVIAEIALAGLTGVLALVAFVSFLNRRPVANLAQHSIRKDLS